MWIISLSIYLSLHNAGIAWLSPRSGRPLVPDWPRCCYEATTTRSTPTKVDTKASRSRRRHPHPLPQTPRHLSLTPQPGPRLVEADPLLSGLTLGRTTETMYQAGRREPQPPPSVEPAGWAACTWPCRWKAFANCFIRANSKGSDLLKFSGSGGDRREENSLQQDTVVRISPTF
jgi:hypothetical protein